MIKIMLLAVICMFAVAATWEKTKTVTYYIHDKTETVALISRLTIYNAVAAQTDDSPLLTAPAWKIDLTKLNNCQLRWIAVSQKMLKDKLVAYGDTIWLKTNDPEADGQWIVADCMNKMWDRVGNGYCADILVPVHANKHSHGMWNNILMYKRKVKITQNVHYE